MSFSRKLFLQLPDCKAIKPSLLLPKKYTQLDWKLNSQINFEIINNREKFSEKVVDEAQRITDETRDTTISMKKEVDNVIKQRINEIKFLIDELKNQRKAALSEEESLKLYRKRIENLIKFLSEKSLPVCEKCIQLRKARIDVDLVKDEVNFELRKEFKTIDNIRKELTYKVLLQINEGIRRLRASIYLLDKDMSNKDMALRIDEKNLLIAETQLNLSVYEPSNPLNICEYTLQEWEHITYKNINNNAKDISAATSLKSFIEILLKQCIENLQNQTLHTNNAFSRQIDEIRYVKQCLESKHKDVTNSINNVRQQISETENELNNKQSYLTVCQKRLFNRKERPKLEQTCDSVQSSLRNELNNLNKTKAKLNGKFIELKATLSYLLHSQIIQEEQINIKMNILKIDENDCMTIRQGLIYQSF